MCKVSLDFMLLTEPTILTLRTIEGGMTMRSAVIGLRQYGSLYDKSCGCDDTGPYTRYLYIPKRIFSLS